MPKKIDKKQVREDREALANAFPRTFMSKGVSVKHPLEVGIHRRLIAMGVRGLDGEKMSAKRVRAAVADYCSGPKYAWGMLFTPYRINLEGKVVSSVAQENIEHARAYLIRRGLMIPVAEEKSA
ncbi:ProQ/FINO family protein [Magnetospirillum molischianum]|uniref:ProQ/FinO domain-containing protein n=1 Tax=Magnetospirillum molischianum DSM 120 TaxID=1150626 RepID=H8FYB1_MAGML|nr:ProQ/FINO family protein [Magnetospirillum molischianum]CCG43349.1 hypothetical protein PHAMO_80140 [Magnetospirillum molischianum DSM 120]